VAPSRRQARALLTGYATHHFVLLTTYSSLLTTHYSPHHQLQALALLTGFPTERLALQGPEQPAAARYAAALTLTRARTRTLTATLTQPEP
jgi:hypothetical protein